MIFKVFAGYDERQAEAAEVFRYSVREHASIEVEINFISAHPGGPHKPAGLIHAGTRAGVTQFSYARFLVPAACGFSGRAAFADGCDQLCVYDIGELADYDLGGRALAVVKHPSLPNQHGLRARSWTSLMLMDCGHPKLRRWTPEYVERAPDSTLMRLADFHDHEIGELSYGWNRLAKPDEEPEIQADDALIHWSYLSDPEGGSWIDRSGSRVWAAARERWRASL
jgi:hypothetical protein